MLDAVVPRKQLKHWPTPTPSGGRGCPIGLGVNLNVTETEPATEMTSVAGTAPAGVLATPPTYLRRPLRRFADGSRPPTPEGSLHGFPGGDVATPIHPSTGRPSLPPSSSARSPIGPLRSVLSLTGGLRVYRVPETKRRAVQVVPLCRWPDICGRGPLTPHTWPRTFWSKPISTFGLS